MEELFLGKKLLFVTAHPDDESFLAAGTISSNSLNGGRTFLFCATKGEKGFAYIKKSISKTEIEKIRKKELLEVGKHLGINKIKLGNFPDGSIVDHRKPLENELLKFMLICSPDFVISFGDDGFTGHQDHIVVGDIAKKIAKKLKVPFLQFCKPPECDCANFKKYLLPKRINGKYIERALDTEPNVRVSVNEKIKLKALKMYKSQFKGLNPHKIFPKRIASHILNNEYFYKK